MQGKCKKYQHGQLMDEPDQFRTFLPSTPKSWAELNPVTETLKFLRKTKQTNKATNKKKTNRQQNQIQPTNHLFSGNKRVISCGLLLLPLAPSLFSFLVWKGADPALILHNLSKEQVSQSNYLSICMTRFRNLVLKLSNFDMEELQRASSKHKSFILPAF